MQTTITTQLNNKMKELKQDYRNKVLYMQAHKPYAMLTPANFRTYKQLGKDIAWLRKEILDVATAIARQHAIYKRIGVTAIPNGDGFSYKVISTKQSRFA